MGNGRQGTSTSDVPAAAALTDQDRDCFTLKPTNDYSRTDEKVGIANATHGFIKAKAAVVTAVLPAPVYLVRRTVLPGRNQPS